MFCQDKNKATVDITSDPQERVISNNCPVNVQVTPVAKGVTIQVIGDIELSHNHNPNQIVTEFDPNGLMTDSYSLRLETCSLQIGCGANSPNNKNEPYYQAQILKNGVYTGLRFGTIGWYSVNLHSVVFGSGNSFLLKVSDSKKILYQKIYEGMPNFKVTCDDECPPNHIRCETTKYPGYCCLPCQPIADRINNLASRI